MIGPHDWVVYKVEMMMMIVNVMLIALSLLMLMKMMMTWIWTTSVTLVVMRLVTEIVIEDGRWRVETCSSRWQIIAETCWRFQSDYWIQEKISLTLLLTSSISSEEEEIENQENEEEEK